MSRLPHAATAFQTAGVAEIRRHIADREAEAADTVQMVQGSEMEELHRTVSPGPLMAAIFATSSSAS